MVTGTASASNKVVVLGEDNYHLWSFQVKNLLQAVGVWECVAEEAPAHPGEQAALATGAAALIL